MFTSALTVAHDSSHSNEKSRKESTFSSLVVTLLQKDSLVFKLLPRSRPLEPSRYKVFYFFSKYTLFYIEIPDWEIMEFMVFFGVIHLKITVHLKSKANCNIALNRKDEVLELLESGVKTKCPSPKG